MICSVGIPAPAALHIFACPGLQDHLPIWGSVDFTKEVGFSTSRNNKLKPGGKPGERLKQ